MIDLRSDTVTQPDEKMRAAMARAEVGDDVYGEDPTVRDLEERIADMFGFEASLFTMTGSLANLLAVRLLVSPGEEVLCESQAHIARAEMGAHASVNGLTMRTWTGERGGVDLAAIRDLFAPDLRPHLVRTAAVSVENTHNFGGGTVLRIADLRAVREFADREGCGVHLDGARIWNAHVASGVPLADYGAVADTMSLCLSKGLGAPVGSLVLGSAEHIRVARERRKVLGGGWRQAGVLAAAGLYAVDHNLARLADDHRRARRLAAAAGVEPGSVDTNIVRVRVDHAPSFVEACAKSGVRVGMVDPRTVRLVTHLDVSETDVERACEVLAALTAAGEPTS